MGFRTFTTVGELLWYYCFPVCGSHTRQLWYLILSWLCPSYFLTVASSLSFDMGYLFLVGSSVFLLMVVQQLVAILMFLQEEMNAHPSTLPSSSVQFSSVTQCLTLCDPMNCSTPDLPVHHQLPEFTQIHVHWVGSDIQPSYPLSSSSPPALNFSQHWDLFKWVNSSKKS